MATQKLEEANPVFGPLVYTRRLVGLLHVCSQPCVLQTLCGKLNRLTRNSSCKCHPAGLIKVKKKVFFLLISLNRGHFLNIVINQPLFTHIYIVYIILICSVR